MQGIKVSAVMVIALVATTFVNNCKATRFQYTENAPAVNDKNKEAQVILGCFGGCKSTDAQCFVQCVQKEYPGKNPIEMFDSLMNHVAAVEVIFCTVGCGISEVCEDVRAIGELLSYTLNLILPKLNRIL